MKSLLKLLSSLLLAASAAGQCSLCPGGTASITDGNAQLTPLSDTCAVIEAGLAAANNCESAIAEATSEFDMSGFCCSDVGVANIECSFCDGGAFDTTKVLGVETNPQGLTCGESKVLADFTKGSDSFTCQKILGANAGCCQPSCSVCPQGSIMASGDRFLPGQSFTCGEFDLELAQIQTDDLCSAEFKQFANYDIAAYCGCSGVEAPKSCSYCGFGLNDRDAVVEGSRGLQCSQFERLADFIRSDTVCSTWTECCNAAPTAAPEIFSAGPFIGTLTMAVTVTVTGIIAMLMV